MKNRLSLMLLLVTFLSFAQNKFEQGYYIDNSGVKTECKILKKKWINSPDLITIKTNNNETKEINCNEIIEFSVENIKFKKELYKAEISSINSESLKFAYKQKLIRVLLENENHKLYMLKNENYNKSSFFIKNNNDTIKELINKKYENEENTLKILPFYRQQLLNLGNSKDSKQKINQLNYNTIELIDYVKSLSNSANKIYINKDSIQVNLKFGVYNYIKSQSLYLSGNINQQMQFSKQHMYGINSELELIPPIFKRHYSLFLEFGFDLKEYKDKTDVVRPIFINPDYHIEYRIKNKFRSNIGLRRYFKINSNLNINLSSKYAFIDKYEGNLFVQRDIDKDFTLKQRSLTFSTGIDYKNISFELSFVRSSTIDSTINSTINSKINSTINSTNYILFNLKYNLFKKHLKYTSLN